MALSESEIDSIIGDVRNELRAMSASEQRMVTQNRDSLLSWLYGAVRRVASFVGEIVSAPIKAVYSFFVGLFEGFFR